MFIMSGVCCVWGMLSLVFVCLGSVMAPLHKLLNNCCGSEDNSKLCTKLEEKLFANINSLIPVKTNKKVLNKITNFEF